MNYSSIVHVSLSTEENIHGTSHVCIAHDLLDAEILLGDV